MMYFKELKNKFYFQMSCYGGHYFAKEYVKEENKDHNSWDPCLWSVSSYIWKTMGIYEGVMDEILYMCISDN